MRKIDQPNPELVALAGEPILWKRVIRFLGCLLLHLTGKLALVIRRLVRRRRLPQPVFSYHSVVRRVEPTLLAFLRSPPQPR